MTFDLKLSFQPFSTKSHGRDLDPECVDKDQSVLHCLLIFVNILKHTDIWYEKAASGFETTLCRDWLKKEMKPQEYG